ncbi:hypothetical protein [Sphingomonas sp. DT-204]|uniref:hypothetical protein n=1 Tax=Sphingomonas sp. DT-204 TaxID=3396166 RepID=UPI003F1AC83A
MNKAWGLLMAAAALGGCDSGSHQLRAEVVLSDSGQLTLTCKQSSSGECHGLVLGTTQQRAVAKPGASATIDGVVPGSRFCADDVAPQPNKCDLKELTTGTMIISRQTVGKH